MVEESGKKETGNEPVKTDDATGSALEPAGSTGGTQQSQPEPNTPQPEPVKAKKIATLEAAANEVISGKGDSVGAIDFETAILGKKHGDAVAELNKTKKSAPDLEKLKKDKVALDALKKRRDEIKASGGEVPAMDKDIARLEGEFSKNSAAAHTHLTGNITQHDTAFTGIQESQTAFNAKIDEVVKAKKKSLLETVKDIDGHDKVKSELEALDKRAADAKKQFEAYTKAQSTTHTEAKSATEKLITEHKTGALASAAEKDSIFAGMAKNWKSVEEGGKGKLKMTAYSVGAGVFLVDGLRRLMNAISGSPGKDADGKEQEAPGFLLPVVELAGGVGLAVLAGKRPGAAR